MAATPKVVRELIDRHIEYLNYIDGILNVKRDVPLENQAEHVKSKSEEYWEGLADGANVMLENVLHAHHCYAGFMYVSPKIFDEGLPHWRGVGPQDPLYKGWRRHYFTK